LAGGDIVTEKSRTEYSARNTAIAMAAKMIAILTGYVTRMVFTHTLSEDYVGVNGLFTDILNVLALSELGVGTAIAYAVYKPVAQRDVEKQKSLMRMYRRFYRMVAAMVLGGGLLVLPFLDVLAGSGIEHLTLIYLMYLLNSALSYLLAYKRSLIDAHQLSYITVLYQTVFLLLQNGLQAVILLLTGNFLLYVSVMIMCTMANNICVSAKADRLYPYLKERRVQELPKEEKQSIYTNIRAMLMHKVGNVIVNNTDNLLLSSLVGIASAGRYSNYYLIIGSVRQVLEQMFRGITASVGNLGAQEGGGEHVRKIFEASFFAGQWIFGLASICLYELVDGFVGISFGEQYVFGRDITLVLCLNFYLMGMRQAVLVFRDTMGLFWYDRYVALAEAAINLVVSVALGKFLGTVGIFLGTLVSTVSTSFWVEPLMLYRHRLKAPAGGYFLRYARYASVTFLLWAGTDWLCGMARGDFWTVFFLRMVICVCVVNLAYLLVYHRTEEFGLLWRKALGILRKRQQGKAAGLPGMDRAGNAGLPEPGRGEAGVSRSREFRTAGAGHCRGELCGAEFGAKEACLLSLLRGESALLWGESADLQGELDWEKLAEMAQRHKVLPLLYESAAAGEGIIPETVRQKMKGEARKTVMQSYRLLFLCKYLTGKLDAAGIAVVILKGVGTASYYAEPELRKSGDVDLLLLEPEKLEEAGRVLEACGCVMKERQLALHHVVYAAGEGIAIELHTMLAEPFDNERMNRYLQERLAECREHVVRADVMGVELPILAPGFHAYELLLHMLQHFLRAGFGLKLLYDWVMFWSRGADGRERKLYLRLVEESGIKGFSDTVTDACCRYLGLRREAVEWMGLSVEEAAVREFMGDVLEAEEFGNSASERMVILRDAGFAGYVREFHHQTKLNFPRAAKCFLCWPVLWILTLARFLRNNRKVRGVSVHLVMKSAGQRSRLIAEMGLWEKR